MSDDITREEFEALRERVADLEARLDDQRRYEDPGLDRMDATVLDTIEPGATLTKRALVNLYKQRTQVTNPSTAKQRAKNLARREFFGNDAGRLVFYGVDADE
jgi:hypothetical protein